MNDSNYQEQMHNISGYSTMDNNAHFDRKNVPFTVELYRTSLACNLQDRLETLTQMKSADLSILIRNNYLRICINLIYIIYYLIEQFAFDL